MQATVTEGGGGLPRGWWAAVLFAAALCVVAAGSWSSRRSTAELIETGVSVGQAHQVIERLSSLLAGLVSVQTGARGFALTGEERFLEPYQAALGDIGSRLRALREATRDNSLQQSRIDTLDSLVTRHLSLQKERIRVRREQGMDATRALILGGEGEKAMDLLRGVIAAMQAEEKALLERRQSESREAASRTARVAGAATAASLLVLSGLFLLLRRVAEEAQRSAAKTAGFQEALDQFAIVAETDARGRITYANDVFCRVAKYRRDELIGKDHREVVNSGYHPPEFWRSMWGTIGQGRVWHGDIRNHAKDGSIYWVDTTIVPFVGADGKPERYLAIRAVITERKEAERRLEDQAALLAAVVENISDGVVVADAAGRFLVFNPAAKRIAGMGASEAAPSEWSAHYGVFLPDGETPFPAEGLALARAMRGLSTDEHEELLRNEGHPQGVRISVSGRPLRDAAGNLIGGVVAFRDITARRAAEEELLRAKEAAESASQAKTRFLANISHELRSPLNSIIGYPELMLKGRDGELNAEQRADLETVLASGKHLLGLINELIDLAKIESGKLDLYPEPVSPGALVEEVRKSFAEAAASKGLALEMTVEGSPGPVFADRQRLRQVLFNLVQNALKFTVRGRVAIGVRADGGEAVFSVEDTGPGISPEELRSVFERFQQSKSLERMKKGEGMGLGLHLVRHFVGMHGGRVWAKSEPGRGSSFFVSLPLLPAAGKEALK